MPRVRVLERPEDLPDDPDPAAVHVVVDVLRFSTTACTLLEAGARHLRPFGTPQDARAWREATPEALLVGESQGEILPGFDANNSPTQAPRDLDVAGRPVGVVTTNGTRTIQAVGPDPPLAVGTLANAPALARLLDGAGEAVVVGAGWEGDPTQEDTAVAELLATWLEEGRPDGDRIEEAREDVRSSVSASHLRDLGFEADVEAAASVGASDVVPVRQDGLLRDGAHGSARI